MSSQDQEKNRIDQGRRPKKERGKQSGNFVKGHLGGGDKCLKKKRGKGGGMLPKHDYGKKRRVPKTKERRFFKGEKRSLLWGKEKAILVRGFIKRAEAITQGRT